MNLERRVERLEQYEGSQQESESRCREVDEALRRVHGIGPDEPLPTEEQLLRRDMGYDENEPLPEEAVAYLQKSISSVDMRTMSGGDRLIAILEWMGTRGKERSEIVSRFRRTAA
jgi:hypothetical protein